MFKNRSNTVGKVATTIINDDGWENWTIVRYHQTEVVKFNHNYIILDSGGWLTNTTKTRMNQTSGQFELGFQVWQVNFNWIVRLPNGREVKFVDNLTIDRKTGGLKEDYNADKLAVATKTIYTGDVNLEYGGLFVDLSDWRWKFADVTRVTDLDSGAGFSGAVMIERGSVNLPEPKTIREAIKSSGGFPRGCQDPESRKLFIIESLVWYMGFDVDGPDRLIIQTESDGPMSYDGWKADIKLFDGESLVDWFGHNLNWIT